LRILFITATRIGDAVMTTGLLKHLLETYPQAKVTIACGPLAADLFRAVPNLERLILIKKRTYNRHWIELWRACIGTRWDLIIDLRNSAITRLLRAKERHCKTKSNTGEAKIAEYAQLLHLKKPPLPFLWTDETAKQNAKEAMPGQGPVLALGPSANWPPKQWPAERFAALAQGLTAPGAPLAGAKIMIIAAPHELDQLKPLFAALPAEQVLTLVGHDLLTVAACLARATLFIGNDSGLSHMAAAMQTPTLALFGPGFEKIYAPSGSHAAVLRSPIATSALLARLPYPGAREPNLMEEITVDAALKAAKRLLKA